MLICYIWFIRSCYFKIYFPSFYFCFPIFSLSTRQDDKYVIFRILIWMCNLNRKIDIDSRQKHFKLNAFKVFTWKRNIQSKFYIRDDNFNNAYRPG